MTRPRTLIPMLVLLAVAGWATACGDGATEPPSPDPPRATNLTVTPATAALTALGETVRLAAEVRDQNGQAMAGAVVTWSSGDPSVATVDATGLVTAAGNGMATITATSGSVSGSAAVTVAQAVSAVAVSPAVDTLVALGDTVRLTAAATDANGHAVAGTEFSWASGDTTVATVDASGLVTGVAPGEAEIAATSSGVTGRAAFAVVDPAPSAVAVTPDTVVLSALGQTAQLAAEVRDQIGRVMEGGPIVWSSADTTVAAVDTAGSVTAIGGGATTIAATAGEVSGTAVVTVMQSAGSVVVSPLADTVAPGDTLRLAAEAFDENGHRVKGAEFTWSSSNVSVARVDGSGLVTGAAEGTATITATTGSASGTSEITVENPDRAALAALYHATDGPNWRDNENWLTDAPLAEWYGVGTDASRRVVHLDFKGEMGQQNYLGNGLRGPIPSELANLAKLRSLDFRSNTLTGPIPPELGSLARLEELDLGENALTGPIPTELGSLSDLITLDLGNNNLTGSIPAELGNLANLTSLSLSWNGLSGSIPPELGNLTNLTSLLLNGNNLSGPIPPELGNLANLWLLGLRYNELSGPIPGSFLQLDQLRGFHIVGNESLCVPGSSVFVAWHLGIERRDEEPLSCNATDVAALKSLFEATGGSDWTNSTDWLGEGAVEEWHGVAADSLGRVTELDLADNELAGELPPTLGQLVHMTELRVSGNPGLAGRLPLALARLSLQTLHYSATGLCAPVEPSFRAWLDAIPSHEGTGTECAPLSDREILEVLYHATGGPNWINTDNWLTDAPLREWHGVWADSEDRVIGLSLLGNGLTGSIPAELGSLVKLVGLTLRWDELTGTIPPELGNLVKLERLSLYDNGLTGSIPPELGKLTSLVSLNLEFNHLSGTVPKELGNIVSLKWLSLNGNELEGTIPPELGNLVDLEILGLDWNHLTGSIPPQLGKLTSLESLRLRANKLSGTIPEELGGLGGLQALILASNNLSGPLPSSFGGLTSLKELGVARNGALSGPLPSSLTNLRSLERLVAGGTGLCIPGDAVFIDWISTIQFSWVARCSADASAAYLTQAVQSREFPVPLVAGDEALLRVFPTAAQSTSVGIPAVRARFYNDGRETHIENIPAKSTPIPTSVDESNLANSANATIPGRLIQPGLEMVIEIDPDGTLDSTLGVSKRIPETGRLAVEVHEMPVLDLTVIPFVWTETQDSSIVDLIRAMAADPENHEMLEATRTLLPVGAVDVTAHEPVLTSRNSTSAILAETDAIRALEAGGGHWMGMMSEMPGGRARRPGRVSVSMPVSATIAHELGHNMNLQHAPCGGPDLVDVSYPYPDGSIGSWGYDFRDGGSLVHPSTPDLMSYCGPPDGVSDYHFMKALRYRLFDEGSPSVAASAAPSQSLLVWGGIGADTVPYLEPTFVIEAAPALPDSAGAYEVTGHSADGSTLFSLSFDMPETADGDGSSSFAFVLPVRPKWGRNLASITLTGPGGSFTLDGDSDMPMAILRNPQTGQIRGILRDPPPATQAAADAVGQDAGTRLDVLFSRGIPGAEAWRR